MILNSLTIENIRLFQGTHTLDLSPYKEGSRNRHIILIGGKNGAGKTTLFESILLCLYGRQIPGIRKSKSEYEQYIEQMISKNQGDIKQKKGSIQIGFEFSHMGVTHKYLVKREWAINSHFLEDLTVFRDEKILSEIESDQWQDLLNDLIPSRFSRLFLFDGEKIQNLVEDNAENVYLRDSFKSLLGLDLTERLKNDLNIYLGRKLKNNPALDSQKIEEIEIQLKEVQEKKEILLQEQAQHLGKKDLVQSAIERQELLLSSEGGSFAKKRDDLQQEKNNLEGEITRAETDIRELCSGLFPFAISPKYCQILKKQLIKEDALEAKKRSKQIIAEHLDSFHIALFSDNFLHDSTLTPQQKTEIKDQLSALIKRHFEFHDTEMNDGMIHHLSQKDFHTLLQWIDIATINVPEQMVQKTHQLENLTQERQRIEGMINQAPSEDILKPMVQELHQLHQKMGELSGAIRKNENELKSLDYTLNELDRQKRKKEEEIKNYKSGETRIELAQKVSVVLDEYMYSLQKLKINQLSDTILQCFTRLMRKEEYIEKIVIDDNYLITLHEPDGHSIPKEKLSAGEKEIFAISVLWGLTLTSGRQFPFIIDTPLGRLDSDHRGNLVMDFFQNAGDQMIIFSTDTEIDLEYYRILEPFIARAYHLDYQKKERQTEITPGYFWSSAVPEVKS